METGYRKIVNDPVYGFITIDQPLVFAVIQHPIYQRLRRISQMALANLVYPGAVHSRFQHSLGAYHLMHMALQELKDKGTEVSREEETGAKIAILLHDIGHGPYSHALENTLAVDKTHEEISLLLMEGLRHELGEPLGLALEIFRGTYPKKFLHQLVSSQLDMDRMDYLNRDSFYTGVHEGVIGYDRILKMLTVHQEELMVEEKGIYSIEKFIIARRLMYWQVYLHKTVLSAERMLVKILTRARELSLQGIKCFASPSLSYFLESRFSSESEGREQEFLHHFCRLDDYDILGAIKVWATHEDFILATLCSGLVNRNLFKLTLGNSPFGEEHLALLKEQWRQRWPRLDNKDLSYFVFTGTASNNAYNVQDEQINILFKSGEVRDISSIEYALIGQTVSLPIKKFYICHPKT